MQSLLYDIRNEITRYCQMTTAVLDLCVDVIDSGFIRVAGTVRYDEEIGKPLRHGHFFKDIISRSEIMFIESPAIHPHCSSCENLHICGEWARLYAPIFMDGEVIGAISLSANSAKQHVEMIRNKDRFVDYIKSMTGLVSLKAKELMAERRQQYNLELQQQLTNLINEGVIILDHKLTPLFMNEKCEYILECKLLQIPYLDKHGMFQLKIESTSEDGKATVNMRVRERRLVLYGDVHKVANMDGTGQNTVFIFHDLRREPLTNSVRQTFDLSEFSGRSNCFIDMLEACRKAAFTDEPLLLWGENGIGKENLARAIHNEGLNKTKPFYQNASLKQIAEQLNAIEYSGKNESFSGCTVYIDEVLKLEWEEQKLLVQIINDTGSSKPRIICGTTGDLKQEIQSGNFNSDLYFLLEMSTISIPSLRDRGETDIRLLAQGYLDMANERMGRKISFSQELWPLICKYPWYGNSRELQNFVDYIVEDAKFELGEAGQNNIPGFLLKKIKYDEAEVYDLAEAEKALIIKALNELGPRGYSKQQIAKKLGIGSATLYRKIKEYNIQSKYAL